MRSNEEESCAILPMLSILPLPASKQNRTIDKQAQDGLTFCVLLVMKRSTSSKRASTSLPKLASGDEPADGSCSLFGGGAGDGR